MKPTPPRVGEAVRDAAAALAAGSDTPRLDAELLMAHALGCSRDVLLLSRMRDASPPGFAGLVARRMGHEPVAYITGSRDFWSITLAVGPGVLVPRPDSETLIEAAVDHFAGTAGPARVLDLGTGPGTLLLAALAQWPDATGLGIDASAVALDYAGRNAAALQMAGRATLAQGDWLRGRPPERFGLVLCNPPYVGTGEVLPREVAGHEPAAALFAGADGLDDYRILAPMIAGAIAPGGVGVVEIGWTQAAAAGALFAGEGLRVGVRRDLGGRDRALILQHP